MPKLSHLLLPIEVRLSGREVWNRPPANSKALCKAWLNGKRLEPWAEPGSNSLVGQHVVREGLTNKTGLKRWSRRYKLVARAKHDRLNRFTE